MDAASPPGSLHADRFALSIGHLSVGLPPCATADHVLERYLDLIRLLRRGPRAAVLRVPDGDLRALARLTRLTPRQVARRLDALQGAGCVGDERSRRLPAA